QPGKEPVPILGSNLKELEKKGLRLFKIYGPDDTTGLDMANGPDKMMTFVPGENPDAEEVAQALLRLREFLKALEDRNLGQGVIWCIPEAMKPKILTLRGKKLNAQINAKECFLWALEIYQHKMEAEIAAAAYQEIEGLFVEIVRRKLRTLPAKDQIIE